MRNGHSQRLTVEIPDEVGFTEQTLKEYLTAKLYGDGTRSLGQAAEMLGKTKWDMPKILSRFEVPYFHYSVEDFEKEHRFGPPSDT